ncbi:unnamed protein product [Echinostoma caproni]|uniref:HRDC domain-containing protein n=1 Tax=Echinostoma caproni TaxID=27848 RepID=A0A183AYF5_9TREM|nr:unnamed protein product [Echinostoma caproni]
MLLPEGLHIGRNIWHTQFDEARVDAMALPRLPPIFGKVNKVDVAWESIRDGIIHLMDTFAPVTHKRTQTLEPPWFDLELRGFLRRRNRAWRAVRATGVGYDLFWRKGNHFTDMKRVKRRTFKEKLVADSLNTPKLLFVYLKRHTRARAGILSLIDGFKMVEINEGKAEDLVKQLKAFNGIGELVAEYVKFVNTEFCVKTAMLT